MCKPRNMSMKMLESIDVIELSNQFTLDMIAHTFNCSTQYVRNCIMRQEIRDKKDKNEFKGIRSSNNAWQDLKNTELYQKIMSN